MNFLGVGPFELLLILIVATVVLGPERMAKVGRTLGRRYAQFRKSVQGDRDEMLGDIREELAMLHHELDGIRQTTEGEIRTTQAELQSTIDTTANAGAVVPKIQPPDKRDGVALAQTVEDGDAGDRIDARYRSRWQKDLEELDSGVLYCYAIVRTVDAQRVRCELIPEILILVVLNNKGASALDVVQKPVIVRDEVFTI